MKQLRKPAKKLADKLNKKRYLRATVKLNNGKTVPKTITNILGQKEDLIYATKSEQRGLKQRGGAGKLTKHKIKSFYMEGSASGNYRSSSPSQTKSSNSTASTNAGRGTTGMQQGSNNFNSQRSTTSNSSTSNQNSGRGTTGMQQGNQNFNNQSNQNNQSQSNQNNQSQSNQNNANTNANRGTTGMQQGNQNFNNQNNQNVRDPTRNEALAEGVRSLAEKASKGISTPMASGSPLNNPVDVSPFGNLRNAVIQRQAAQAEDLTSAAYKKSMTGVEDLTRAAYNRFGTTPAGLAPSFSGVQNLGLSPPSMAPRTDRMPTAANRLADMSIKGDSELTAPTSSDITEDYRTGVPQDAVPMPRTKVDANLSFLKSRATNPETSFTNMSPTFVNSLSNLVRAAELKTGEKMSFKNKSAAYRDQEMQKDIRARGLAQGFPAAPAGLSRHQFGSAVDIPAGVVRDAMADLVARGLAPGIQRAKVKDAPHFEESDATYTRSPTRQSVSYSPASEKVQYSKAPTQVASRTFSPPSNFSKSPAAPTAVAKNFSPPSNFSKSPAAPTQIAAIQRATTLGDAISKAVAAAKSLKGSIPNLGFNPAAKGGLLQASSMQKLGIALASQSTLNTIAGKTIAKSVAPAFAKAQTAFANWQKGTMTQVAAAKSLQKAATESAKVKTASFSPTEKAVVASTKATIQKMQDRLVAEKEPSVISQIIDHIPAVQAVRRVTGATKSLATKLTQSREYKDDQAKLAAMSPAQRATELSRRAGTGGDKSDITGGRKLTASDLTKAAKTASTAVANSKYTSEGYLA